MTTAVLTPRAAVTPHAGPAPPTFLQALAEDLRAVSEAKAQHQHQHAQGGGRGGRPGSPPPGPAHLGAGRARDQKENVDPSTGALVPGLGPSSAEALTVYRAVRTPTAAAAPKAAAPGAQARTPLADVTARFLPPAANVPGAPGGLKKPGAGSLGSRAGILRSLR